MRGLLLLGMGTALTTWIARLSLQPASVIRHVEPAPPSIVRRSSIERRACPSPGQDFVAHLWELDSELHRRELAASLYRRERIRLAETAPVEVLTSFRPEVVRPVLADLLPSSATATWRCDGPTCSLDATFDSTQSEDALAFATAVDERFPETVAQVDVDGETHVLVCVLPPKTDEEPARLRYHRWLARERLLELQPWSSSSVPAR